MTEKIVFAVAALLVGMALDRLISSPTTSRDGCIVYAKDLYCNRAVWREVYDEVEAGGRFVPPAKHHAVREAKP